MLRYYGIVRDAARVVTHAAQGALESFGDGAVEQEPALTDRMLGRIEQALDGYASKGVRWRAKTLTDRGQNAQESRFGADFAGVAELTFPDYEVGKGFLAQAKILQPGSRLSPRELNRLQEQCAQMISRTPASFVFVYAREYVSVIPAVAVLGSKDGDLHAHYQRSIGRFYEEHFTCFIGDRAISEPTPHMLDSLPERIPARVLLAIHAGFE